jgi:amino acid transporter
MRGDYSMSRNQYLPKTFNPKTHAKRYPTFARTTYTIVAGACIGLAAIMVFNYFYTAPTTQAATSCLIVTELPASGK